MAYKSLDKPAAFISIRAKLLIISTLLFTGAFGLLFYLFYNFAVDIAVQRMRKNLDDALNAAAQEIDVKDVLALYREGTPNAQGFSDHPLYRQQMELFQKIHDINPDVWPYSFVRGNQADTRRAGEPVLTNNEVVFLVDLWSAYDSSKAAKFLEPYAARPQMIESLEKGILVYRPEIPFKDKWGGWITAYGPLRDDKGQVVLGVGIGADLTAEYLSDIKRGILQRMIWTFIICYIILFTLIYIMSDGFTRRAINLAQAANKISEGNYEQDLLGNSKVVIEDEITQLADIFKVMLDKVRTREFKLKQQVSDLKIEIDGKKRLEAVKEITDNDFFKELTEKAKAIREQYQED
ncbi:hypothetical protein [Nodosilinea sp. E11]|uniref:HAMP domain-containing protein n=1 Tax=Nodosilinea sp. E11 TaxID=3037479 RepID=UPI0029345E17|nr:hypothetical protein [Nodosilinea sp. E11]WOD37063.1 hypothetical protein RRF56_00985 [Nodosilinea sp. E11]